MRDFPSPPQGAIEIADLKVRHREACLLDVPHLVLDGPGPSLIMGPNGAGKSLLLRAVHGLLRPDSGAIRLNGQVIGPSDRMRQAMVFQKPVLLRRSVAANLDYVLRRKGLARSVRRARVAELLAEGGLSDKARQNARSLSGGEAQRLAILRAFATEAEILFLDEPTSALDPASTHAIERLILSAARRGVRIVMVTHDIGQARRLAEDVVLMQQGRVVEQAPAARFFEAPETLVARRFLAGALVL